MTHSVSVKAFNRVRSDIQAAKVLTAHWKDVGAQFGISGGMAFQIAVNNYEPKREDIRKALGLPIFASAQICEKHGVVHVARRCPSDAPRAPRTPRRRWVTGNYKREG